MAAVNRWRGTRRNLASGSGGACLQLKVVVRYEFDMLLQNKLLQLMILRDPTGGLEGDVVDA